MDNKTKIRGFISGFLRSHELQDDEDIFSLGFVNSMFAMELVLFAEKNFGIKVENEDLNIDNFRTINGIDALINRKLVKQ